jgi:RNA polymerase sigma-70 factor (ECF subfamily)
VEALIRAAQAGDEQAFLGIVRETQARLRGFLSARARNREDVDDMAQEAYVTAFRKLAEFGPADDFWLFLRTVALNVARNNWRSERRRREATSDRLGQIVADEALHSLEDAETAWCPEISAALETCLGRLPEDSRQAVRLRYWEDLAPADIAGRMGRSAATVRVWLMRAREMLHRCVSGRLAGGRA